MIDLSSPVFKELLMDECMIDGTADPKLAQNLDRYILIYSDKPQSVQYWYVRRHVLMYQLRRAVELVDRQTGPDRVSASQKFRALRQMLIDTNNELALVDPDNAVPSVGFSTPTHTGFGIDTRFGHFEVLNWPATDSYYWDSPVDWKG